MVLNHLCQPAHLIWQTESGSWSEWLPSNENQPYNSYSLIRPITIFNHLTTSLAHSSPTARCNTFHQKLNDDDDDDCLISEAASRPVTHKFHTIASKHNSTFYVFPISENSSRICRSIVASVHCVSFSNTHRNRQTDLIQLLYLLCFSERDSTPVPPGTTRSCTSILFCIFPMLIFASIWVKFSHRNNITIISTLPGRNTPATTERRGPL